MEEKTVKELREGVAEFLVFDVAKDKTHKWHDEMYVCYVGYDVLYVN